ncbi:uncharacterized protein METZ01_LOCUS466625, partial [marine metagenome]
SMHGIQKITTRETYFTLLVTLYAPETERY